jgi:glutathione S-transferase
MTKPELVSFKLCPFVQRSVITLLEKNIDFDITYIDLANKPEWFLKISPFGKVPVLKTGDSVLFESAVINEYLDEVNAPSIHPNDPLEKAYNRAWIEFVSSLFMTQFRLSMAKDEESFNKELNSQDEALAKIEDQVKGPFFNGDKFSLVDTSAAPFFMRLEIISGLTGNDYLKHFPKIKQWNDSLLAKLSVQKSVVGDFKDLYIDYLKARGALVTAQLAL